MHSLVVDIFAAFGLLGAGRYLWLLAGFAARAPQNLVVEDYWTWTTSAGSLFEDVDVEGIEDGQVRFHHKFGDARVPIAALSEDSRAKLFLGYAPAVKAFQREQALTPLPDVIASQLPAAISVL